MSTLYPQTKIEWIDQSQIPSITFDTDNSPLFMCAFTSDKGREDLNIVSGADFFKQYGNSILFQKHGQPLLQTARAINAGARVLAKRVVAPDSKLANAIVSVKLTEKMELETKVMELTYQIHSVASATKKLDVDTVAATLLDDVTGVYPLFAIYDIGRGTSDKKFRLSPDFNGSKYLPFLQYKLDIMENAETLETVNCSINPDMIYNSNNFSLSTVINANSKQVRSSMYEKGIEGFITKMATFLEKSQEELFNMDILFGYDKKGQALKNVKFAEDSVNINHVYGIGLQNGSNGTFGDAPLDAVEYEAELAKVFNGQATDAIYDMINYQIDAIIDANYPASVKRAIENLCTFREDIFYFRDLGHVFTVEQMKNVHNEALHNKFSASYHLSYEVIDPYSKKQIPVTIGYSLSSLLVDHFKNGRNRPLSGQLYGFVLTDAVEGTVNYIPRKTPSIDQFQELNDLRINYGSYYGDKLVVETQYTSQEEYTQLSFINNVLAIQELIKDIRKRCPYTRYTFLDGDDFKKYQKDVERIIAKHKFNFADIKFTYLEDPTMIQNKIYYASIEVKCRNYIQAEYFKIYTIN